MIRVKEHFFGGASCLPSWKQELALSCWYEKNRNNLPEMYELLFFWLQFRLKGILVSVNVIKSQQMPIAHRKTRAITQPNRSEVTAMLINLFLGKVTAACRGFCSLLDVKVEFSSDKPFGFEIQPWRSGLWGQKKWQDSESHGKICHMPTHTHIYSDIFKIDKWSVYMCVCVGGVHSPLISDHLQQWLSTVWERALSFELSYYCWGEIALTPSAQFVCFNPTPSPTPTPKPVCL